MYNPNAGQQSQYDPMMDYSPTQKDSLKRLASPKNVFIGTGAVLLGMLCIVPIWNAMALLDDVNYVFWQGTSVPTWMIVLCVSIIVLYVLTILAFFNYARPQVQTEQTIMMIANIFITLLGLVLMLLSLPLSQQSIDTYNNLMHRCDYSEQTHRMYEYSQVLHNIRRTPVCAAKYSVEECAGYEDAPPYTTFLKAMETNFRCSGFCYRSPTGATTAQQQEVHSNGAYNYNLNVTTRAGSSKHGEKAVQSVEKVAAPGAHTNEAAHPETAHEHAATPNQKAGESTAAPTTEESASTEAAPDFTRARQDSEESEPEGKSAGKTIVRQEVVPARRREDQEEAATEGNSEGKTIIRQEMVPAQRREDVEAQKEATAEETAKVEHTADAGEHTAHAGEHTADAGEHTADAGALLSRKSRITNRQHHHQEYVIALDAPKVAQPASLLQNDPVAAGQNSVMREYTYPPTLFSDANYLASCEGMAARDMKNFAGDVGFQTFYQGIYLVLIAIATGFLKLIGFCVKKDRPKHNNLPGTYG